MKKSILFILWVFIFNFTFAQKQMDIYYNFAKGNHKEIGQLDNNGYPIGVWKYYKEKGSLDYEINWETNYIKHYYESGSVKEEGTFIPKTGVHIGKWITYYKNGEIQSIKIFDKKGVEKTP